MMKISLASENIIIEALTQKLTQTSQVRSCRKNELTTELELVEKVQP